MNICLRRIAEKTLKLKENITQKITRVGDLHSIRLPILMYHHIDIAVNRQDNLKLYVDPQLFEKEMEYLAENGYVTVTLDDLTNTLRKEKPLPGRSVILTFDDGYEDFYTKAFPILKKYKLKATVFVITGMIGKLDYLNIEMLKKMTKSRLISIGSHTTTHPDLTKLESQKLISELTESKKFLENKLQICVNSFAYPYGKYNLLVSNEVAKAGYNQATTVYFSYLHQSNSIFTLSRIRLGHQLTLSDFRRRIML